MKTSPNITATTLFFVLAFLPQLLLADHPPSDAWSWFKWLGTAVLQGLIAIKAVLTPPAPPTGTQPLAEISEALNEGGKL